jgi:hypothetical protein
MPGTQSENQQSMAPIGCHHAAFERRSWLVQRVAWLALSAVVIAALAGAFGRGPLSQKQVVSGDGSLVVHYDRAVRNNSPLRLEFQVDADADGTAFLWISRAYLDQFELCETEPRALMQTAEHERLVLRLSARGQAAKVVLHLKPRRPGFASGDIGLGDPPSATRTLHVEQVILP